MVWSVISGKGFGHLYFVQWTMKHFWRIGSFLRQRSGFLMILFLWKNGASCYTAKRVKEFLVQKNIKLLPWPGYSAKLSPIENIWKLVKREIAKETIIVKRRLIENSKIQEMIQSCIVSMLWGIEAVIQTKGGSTKYWT